MAGQFTVFYNAVRTQHGAHLIAHGWCSEAGWTPLLGKEGAPSHFRLTLTKTGGDTSARAVTPFIVTAPIAGDTKSVHVDDGHGCFQVQVYGVQPAGSGENAAGCWVQSGNS